MNADDFLDACRVVYQRECFIVSKLEEIFRALNTGSFSKDLKLLRDHKDDLEQFIMRWSELRREKTS